MEETTIWHTLDFLGRAIPRPIAIFDSSNFKRSGPRPSLEKKRQRGLRWRWLIAHDSHRSEFEGIRQGPYLAARRGATTQHCPCGENNYHCSCRQPNSGKSVLINAIAGTRLHVGTWPGVTVEKKEAIFEFDGQRIRLVDLPGTYSLSPYTQEEIVARDYLVHDKPDVIINVVDATNLERNLYLTVQMMELGIPIVMAMTIYDEAENTTPGIT